MGSSKTATPEWKAKHAAYMREYNRRPEVVARRLAREAQWREDNKEQLELAQKLKREERAKKRKPLAHRAHLSRVRQLVNWGVDQEHAKTIAKQKCCDACGTENPGRVIHSKKSTMCLDHCHINNHFRGVLCTGCNIMLGFVENNLSKFDLIGGGLKNYALRNGVVYG